MILLVVAVAVGAWALGRLQLDSRPSQGQGAGFGGNFSGGFGGSYNGAGPSPNAGGPNPNGYSSSQNGYAGPPPGTGPMPGSGPMPGAGSASGGPKTSWQRGAPPPGATHAEPGSSGYADGGTSESAKNAWERAREETKRKEDERKAREAERRRKEELEKKLREQREKEAREREAREREAQARRQSEEAAREAKRKEAEAEAKRRKEEAEERERRRKEEEALEQMRKEREEALEKMRIERELAELRLKEAREREARERDIREKRRLDEEARAKRLAEIQAREKKRREDEAAKKAAEEAAAKKKLEEAAAKKKLEEAAAAAAAAKKKLEEETKQRGSMYAFSAVGEKTSLWPQGRPKTPPPRPAPPSPTKKPPPPTARTYKGADDDANSYRPYDKKPARKNSFNSSYSQSSYAASQSTSRTTPPPSYRAPYTTKDPNKIVIKAVYAFNNAFQKTPTSQLVAGVGSVTDGLVLKITTEGLFIDDDVRQVPQREWDVKAWTMKLVEVWCPSFRQGPAGLPASARVSTAQQSRIRRLWGLDKDKPATAQETDDLVASMLALCKNNCRLRASSSASDDRSSVASDSAYGSINGDETNHRQTGELKRLHVLRASIRDQEGKKYVFVISEEESWKVSVGLQRLRKGTQVRALAVSGMSLNDSKNTLENLGWGSTT